MIAATAQQPQIIRINKDTNQVDISVKPGWFVRMGCCLIWLEIESIWDRMVSCAARKPKKRSSLGMVGDHFSAIDYVCAVPLAGSYWIKLDRTKNFFDKFPPERDKIISGAYVPPEYRTQSSA